MKGIASFDIDMTLLDHKDMKIPDSACRALERMREHYHIVIATGRDLDSRFSAGIKEMVEPDAIVHLNGAKVTVGGQVIFTHEMDKGLLRRLLEFGAGKPFALGMTTGTEDFYTNREQVIRQDLKRWNSSERNFKDPMELLHRPVRTLTYIGDEAGAALVEQAFPEVKLPMFANKEGADVVERFMSKAVGLQKLCAYYGISMKDTVAFGDSMNDFEIVRDAGIGVAMGNGAAPLKQAADYVTTPIDEDGVWNACVALQLFDGPRHGE